MRVRIERRGGFIGRKAAGERDVTELNMAQRAALDRLTAHPPVPVASPGADRFMYTVELKADDGSTTKRFKVPEDKMPDSLAAIP